MPLGAQPGVCRFAKISHGAAIGHTGTHAASQFRSDVPQSPKEGEVVDAEFEDTDERKAS